MLARMVNYRCHLAHEAQKAQWTLKFLHLYLFSKMRESQSSPRVLTFADGVLPSSLTKFIPGFRCSTGGSLLIPTKLFHLEVGLP